MSDTPRTDARIAKFYCPEFPGDLYKNGNKEEFNRGRDWYFFQMVEFAKELERELSKPQPEDTRILTAQEHAIACGNLTLELQSALAMLLNACEEAGWPRTADQMAPMNMARAAMKLHLSSTPQSEPRA